MYTRVKWLHSGAYRTGKDSKGQTLTCLGTITALFAAVFRAAVIEPLAL